MRFRFFLALFAGLVATPVAALVGTAIIISMAAVFTPGALARNLSFILPFGLVGGSLYAAPTTLFGLPLVYAFSKGDAPSKANLAFWGFLFGLLTMTAVILFVRESGESLGGKAAGAALTGGVSGAAAGALMALQLSRNLGKANA